MDQTPLPPQQVPPPQPKGYEFTPAQNTTIQKLSSRMKILAIIYLVFAGFAGIMGLVLLMQEPLTLLPTGTQVAFFAVTGIWTLSAAASFRLIVETRGLDISHLMNALESLLKLYNLQVWLIIAILALAAIGFVLVLMISMAAAV